MIKKIMAVTMLTAALVICSGCSDSSDSKPLMQEKGGQYVIDLPEDTKLVNASWYSQYDDFTYTYLKRRKDEPVEEYVVQAGDKHSTKHDCIIREH